MQIFRIFTALFLSCISSAVNASNSQAGYISSVIVSSGKGFFNQDGPRDSAPSCATVPNRWVFDVTNSDGQSKMALLLTAYAMHKRVAVYGTGDCSAWPDTETVGYFITVD